jgi:diacylglycerol kinase
MGVDIMPTQSEETPDAAPAPGPAAFAKSFVYAFDGVKHTVRTQRNMRVHFALAILAVAAGIWLRISPVEFALLFVAIMNVVVAEMFNTVAEACVDLATREFNPLAKIAKDVAAGAVLLNAALSVCIGLFVFGPHLLALVQHLAHHA